MGNALSILGNPEVRKRLETKTAIASMRIGQAWDNWGHTAFHYGMVPGVFAIGLAYSGEFTLNPVTLFSKIVFS